MNTDKLINRRGHFIFVFTESYFHGKVICDSLLQVKQLINQYPNNHIRIQIGPFRVLLFPSKDNGKTREIDGVNGITDLYRYFNDKSCKYSSIANNIYYNHI